MPSVKYSNYLEMNPAFESVVDIDADKRNKNLWREYIVGEDMENLIEFLCQSVGNESTDVRKSFWVHGSYGTGKSYAAIFVKHLFEEKPEVIDAFLGSSNRLSQFRNRFAKCRKNGDYLVIWKTGCTGIRTGDMMLLEMEQAIYQALTAKFGDKAYYGTHSLKSAVQSKLADPSYNWDHIIDNSELGDDYADLAELQKHVNAGNITAIQAAAREIRRMGGMINNLETFKAWLADIIDGNNLSKSGIFFIWDEFTEYVTHSDDHTVMQQISEYCKVQPFFMMYVVHRAPEMLDGMDKQHYQKITDRFHQVEFRVSADASFDLIANSIFKRNGMEENWKEARADVVKRIKPALPDIVGLDDKITERINDLCPMHPMTIRLLSRVAESFAGAQRTMFRFMKSEEQTGFVGYITHYGPEDQACWLTPEWLWDYFFTRDSDFADKDTKVATYIHHYEEMKYLVENDENAHRVFKVAMLLLAVMSTAKKLYGGKKINGGIAATEECLCNCMAGVMDKKQVKDLLATMEESKVILRDVASNGVVRLQLPYTGGSGDDFKAHYDILDKKYTRYQMFAKDGKLSTEFEKVAWDVNDATFKRMKIAVCCAETRSIDTRLDEITKDLEKNPYKLGLLVVTVRDEAQYTSIQSELKKRIEEQNEPRLTIALVKKAFTDEERKTWLKHLTKQEMANLGGQTADANIADLDAKKIVSTWVATAKANKVIAWNGTQVLTNMWSMDNLRTTMCKQVRDNVFPYAPETIIITSTAYKPCNDAAITAGIERVGANAQMNNVLDSLKKAGVLAMTSIDDLVAVQGGKEATAISAIARMVRDEMNSGHRVQLADLWEKLQASPFGFYSNIACGVLMGFILSFYRNSVYSWTDSAQSTHILDAGNIRAMIFQMMKGTLTTDYLSAGSVTFQQFREYAKAIMKLSDVQVASETECNHSMREAIYNAGAPLWALKYMPDTMYGGVEQKQIAIAIIDKMQLFIAADGEREGIMGDVIQLFKGKGKIKKTLSEAFQDKNQMASAFRTFLFETSPKLSDIASTLSIKPEELNDAIIRVMQGAVYTWTEEQVSGKLGEVSSEYDYLHALNNALNKVYHSIEDVKKELANLFKFMRISLAAIEPLNKNWFPAMQILYKVSRRGIQHLSLTERTQDVEVLGQYGRTAKECLADGKIILADMLEARNEECGKDELDTIYAGLKDLNCETSAAQFDKELRNQLGRISQARNRVLLKERWRSLTGEESIKSWCTSHRAPLLWIVPKETQKGFETLLDVQRNGKPLDAHVMTALSMLEHIDQKILNDDKTIENAFVEIVGLEYREIFKEEHALIMSQAKLKIGNDMSTWTTHDLTTLQQIMKRCLMEKAKKEKLASAKAKAQTMTVDELRIHVQKFMDAHPDLCEELIK